ncbi:MAG: diaminopimelate epimerase [Candidatus Sumerlaeia bacterium]|nr:diaminopimelate epimerase [Candidatus Sumerlaeia bacterium]
MKLDFHKLDGAGNDFVGLDMRLNGLPTPTEMARLVRRLCHRQHGVGADGVLAILPPSSEKSHFVMAYFNADGSRGEMCGNGARCAVVLAHHLGMTPSDEIHFETDAGPYSADLVEGGARIAFPDIGVLPREVSLTGSARPVEKADFLLCGVPHAIVFVEEDLDLVEVDQCGRATRHDPAFAPAGTNVNFAQVREPGTIHVRTYERGVEAETLACGTGSVATVCCHVWKKNLMGPQDWDVIPTGGEALNITLESTGSGFQNITLAGPARIVFQGSGTF